MKEETLKILKKELEATATSLQFERERMHEHGMPLELSEQLHIDRCTLIEQCIQWITNH